MTMKAQYHVRRAGEHLRQAELATDPQVRTVHETLAKLHQEAAAPRPRQRAAVSDHLQRLRAGGRAQCTME